jgi:carboxyl-terminal processing protease
LEAVAQLRKENGGPLGGMILDLRNNPGGLVSEARAVADEFLTGGVVFTTRQRGQVTRTARARRSGALRRGPMVTLINEYSASAAELVAGALQDHGRATIVGAPSFGKGSVQTIVDLPDGAGLKLTTARYYTPRGRAIQSEGVQPDVLVKAAYAEDRSFGVIRERDLENALPQQPGIEDTKPEPEPEAESSDEEEAEGDEEETHLGVSREIPVDPVGGADFALSIGYQIVTGVLQRRR